jgi:hypothetical protein
MLQCHDCNNRHQHKWYIFFNWYSGWWGGGVQLSPLGTVATNRPIVPAPGDYDGEIGGVIGRGNQSTCRKPAPVSLCSPQTNYIYTVYKTFKHDTMGITNNILFII